MFALARGITQDKFSITTSNKCSLIMISNTLTGILGTACQFAVGLDLSNLSTMYPVIGLPPSAGASHSISINVLSASTSRGLLGASGTAVIVVYKYI